MPISISSIVTVAPGGAFGIMPLSDSPLRNNRRIKA